MRGKVDASEYKDFILGFIFYKYLSEKEEQFFRVCMGMVCTRWMRSRTERVWDVASPSLLRQERRGYRRGPGDRPQHGAVGLFAPRKVITPRGGCGRPSRSAR